jgi:hypothetical protein
MAPAHEPTDRAKPCELGVVELDPKKNKGRVAVSIRKGSLLFVPTAPALGEDPKKRTPARPETGALDED